MDGSILSTAKRERVDKQYYIDFTITKDEVTDLITRAEWFNSQLLNMVDRSNTKSTQDARQRAEELLCA
jgi:uncharacterized protein (UPF0332 family)